MLKIASLLRRSRRDRRGFTLVELLVVVAILGILAAIAVPRVTENIRAARISADVANERMILNALDAFYLGMTPAGPRLRYPADLTRPADGAVGTNLAAAFIDIHFGDGDGNLEAGEALPAVPTGLANPPHQDYAARYGAGTGTAATVPATPAPPATAIIPAGSNSFRWTSPNGLSTARGPAPPAPPATP